MNETIFQKKRIDPNHYLRGAILEVCDGRIAPEYWPEFSRSGWLCACGTENPAGTESCRSCGVAEDWLKDAFDRDALARLQLSIDQRSSVQRQLDREKSRKDRGRRKALRVSVLLILLLALAALAVFLSVTFIGPAVARGNADALYQRGAFLEAAERYRELGDTEKVRLCRQKHADAVSGIENALWTDSVESPWFSVDDEGRLKVRLEDLEASGVSLDPLILPDVVDDILVTAIDERGFMNADFVISVRLPASVREIGERAFFRCSALREIILPEGIETIGDRAFINCTSLTRLVFPESLKTVGIRMCNNCAALTEVVFGSNVGTIESYAFAGCVSLKTVRLPEQLIKIGEYAFAECPSLERVLYPGSAQAFASVQIDPSNENLGEALVFSNDTP